MEDSDDKVIEDKFDLNRSFKTEDLYDADPGCDHCVIPVPGGGVKCTKCNGWFCY